MEVAVELVKLVLRSFYEEKYVILCDYLLRERVLPDDALADRMQVLLRDVNKIAAKLREDRLLKCLMREESREYDEKNITRTYYYIDFGLFADVVKYRLNCMRRILEERLKNEASEKGYYCGHCKKSYGALDVSKLYNPSSNELECESCTAQLEPMEGTAQATSDSKAQIRLSEQTNPILRLLKRLDDVALLKFDPQEYLSNRENFELAPSTSLGNENGPELRMAGESNKKVGELQVEIMPSGPNRIIHAMPVWHTHSTVTGEQVKEVKANIPVNQKTFKDLSEPVDDYVKYYEKINNSTFAEQGSKRPKTKVDSTTIISNDLIDGCGERTPSPSEEISTVKVKGVLKNIHDITDEDKNSMTEEEYQKYYEAFMALDQ